jgi:hypothetical protein
MRRRRWAERNISFFEDNNRYSQNFSSKSYENEAIEILVRWDDFKIYRWLSSFSNPDRNFLTLNHKIGFDGKGEDLFSSMAKNIS